MRKGEREERKEKERGQKRNQFQLFWFTRNSLSSQRVTMFLQSSTRVSDSTHLLEVHGLESRIHRLYHPCHCTSHLAQSRKKSHRTTGGRQTNNPSPVSSGWQTARERQLRPHVHSSSKSLDSANGHTQREEQVQTWTHTERGTSPDMDTHREEQVQTWTRSTVQVLCNYLVLLSDGIFCVNPGPFQVTFLKSLG